MSGDPGNLGGLIGWLIAAGIIYLFGWWMDREDTDATD